MIVLRLAAAALIAAPAAAQTGLFADDLLSVVSAALYPVEVLAYCHSAVEADRAFENAGDGWTQRNDALLTMLDERAQAAGIDDGARRSADAQALADIKATVDAQSDKSGYCRFIARYVEAGYYDIDQRADLRPALRRIFPPSQ
jgi:hypothetical protein